MQNSDLNFYITKHKKAYEERLKKELNKNDNLQNKTNEIKEINESNIKKDEICKNVLYENIETKNLKNEKKISQEESDFLFAMKLNEELNGSVNLNNSQTNSLYEQNDNEHIRKADESYYECLLENNFNIFMDNIYSNVKKVRNNLIDFKSPTKNIDIQNKYFDNNIKVNNKDNINYISSISNNKKDFKNNIEKIENKLNDTKKNKIDNSFIDPFQNTYINNYFCPKEKKQNNKFSNELEKEKNSKLHNKEKYIKINDFCLKNVNNKDNQLFTNDLLNHKTINNKYQNIEIKDNFNKTKEKPFILYDLTSDTKIKNISKENTTQLSHKKIKENEKKKENR